MTNTIENYLYDVLPELITRAREARAEARRKGKGQDGFDEGRALAYYEVVSYMVGQLEAFGIDRAVARVDPGFNADRDLL
jgi:hypothetical protein